MLIHIVAKGVRGDIVFDAKFQNDSCFHMLLSLLWDKGYDVLTSKVEEENSESNEQ